MSVLVAVVLAGCASVKYGDKDVDAKLKSLAPIPGKLSFYACREDGFLGSNMTPLVVVDGNEIGPLRPNTFVHTQLAPGKHEVLLDRGVGIPGIFGKTGVLPVEGKSGEVVIVWVGAVGGGFGGVNVAAFENKAEAEKCVKGARYIEGLQQ